MASVRRLLAAHFPSKGARHDAGLTIGGFLCRCGFNRPDAELFAEAVTIASGQGCEKVRDVKKAASEAWDEAKRPVGKGRGFPALKDTFGDDVAKTVAKWLGYKSSDEDRRAPDGEPFYREGLEHEAPGEMVPFVRKFKDAGAFIHDMPLFPIRWTSFCRAGCSTS